MRMLALGSLVLLLLAGCRGEQKPSGSAGTSPKTAPSAAASTSTLGSKRYLLHVESPQQVAVGEAATSKIVLEAIGGFHINKEFPLEVTIEAADVKLPKATLAKADAAFKSEREASFEIPFTASQAGEKRFSAKLRFAVCTDKDCYPLRDTLAWTVQVAAGQAERKAAKQ